MNKLKKHWEEQAKEFDHFVLNLVPFYYTMVEALIAVVPQRATRFLDLGCGTGMVTAQIKKRFPEAEIVCIDLAENMLGIAKERLRAFPDVQYILGDYGEVDFPDHFDAVLSSLAMHHVPTDEAKKNLFTKIYQHLNPGGVFFNADVVLGQNAHLQDLNINKWIAFMQSQGVSDEEINGEWIPRYKKTDRPCRLMDEIHWLKEAGFTGVDVVWKYYNVAVYGGYK